VARISARTRLPKVQLSASSSQKGQRPDRPGWGKRARNGISGALCQKGVGVDIGLRARAGRRQSPTASRCAGPASRVSAASPRQQSEGGQQLQRLGRGGGGPSGLAASRTGRTGARQAQQGQERGDRITAQSTAAWSAGVQDHQLAKEARQRRQAGSGDGGGEGTGPSGPLLGDGLRGRDAQVRRGGVARSATRNISAVARVECRV
jgi:hypothetical protein